ncbi:hypothetical protein [Lichenihabitans sp. PAMC28606]|uniref:hypothetical protein n=1 Tax=Lichenihabitans sp. PAMC28606 TaxID=2880932 RepID=UPI0022229A3A|nr:hypothetical protein [Lichenihabitans sp. PAMC28606]
MTSVVKMAGAQLEQRSAALEARQTIIVGAGNPGFALIDGGPENVASNHLAMIFHFEANAESIDFAWFVQRRQRHYTSIRGVTISHGAFRADVSHLSSPL